MTVDVWMLSSYNGKTLLALAFSTPEKLIAYVIDYYSDDETTIAPPNDGDDLNAWIDSVTSSWDLVALAIDHDIMEVD